MISRAFASMKDMLSWCSHLVTEEHGHFYALKGQIHQEELDELSENGLKMPEKVINLAIPELNEQRHLVIF